MEIGNIVYGNSQYQENNNFELNRDDANSIIDIFEKLGFDNYNFNDANHKGKYLTKVKNVEDEGNDSGWNLHYFYSLDNKLRLIISPYYWGSDDKIDSYPNLIINDDKLGKVQINWYKYPFRDSYSNIKLSRDDITGICERLTDELNLKGVKPYYVD